MEGAAPSSSYEQVKTATKQFEDQGETMKTRLCAIALCLTSVFAIAASHSMFSGSWEFNPSKSKNIGMMSQMKMVYEIQQSQSSIDVIARTTFQGKDDESKTHYDLTGKPASNQSPMGGPSETVSTWNGPKLVTTWTSESAVAGGPKVVRTETWSLSEDGKTLTIESVRASNPALVLVFDNK